MTPINAEKAANLHEWLTYYLRLRHWHPWIDAPKRRAAVRAEIRSLLTRLRAWRTDQALRKPPTGGGFPGFDPAFPGIAQRAHAAVVAAASSAPGCPSAPAPGAEFPAEHSLARAVRDLPLAGVRAGEVGAFVHAYSSSGFEVEFAQDPGPPAVATVGPGEIEPVEEIEPAPAKL